MILSIGNLHTKMVAGTDAEKQWLAGYLTFDDARARYIKGLRGDGRIRLFNSFSSSFPSGFLQTVQTAAQEEGHEVELLDPRKPPCQPDLTADLAWLRDYQRTAVEACVERAHGIVRAPTGSGKTELLAALTRLLPCRWLSLVHRTTLVHQAAERITLRTGARVGIVAEGRWEGFDDDTQIVCASYQTLYVRRRTPEAQDILKKAEGICADESHTVPSQTAYATVMATPNAYYRIGLSATPLARGDKRSVLAVAALGPIIYQIKPDVLIEAGVLAKPHIRMVPIHQESERPTWQGVYGELVVRSRQRNAAVVAAVKSAEKPCLVFVRELSHGRILEAALGKAGLRTAFVSGQHSTEWRRSHAKRLEQGHFDAMVVSVVFQEGVDLPELRSVVIACGGASVIAALQRIGRGMRVAAGKDSFEVHDFLDEGQRWMERHARARRRAYSSEGFAVIEGEAAIGAVL